MPAIEVRGLIKDYGSLRAVAGIDFTVAEGEVLALLGPNGAGKTTTVEILEGHRRRSAGAAMVLGFDPESGGRSYRERIGIVLQEGSLEKELTVTEVLETYAAMYPHPRPVGEVIELVGLEDKHRARIKTLSGGQRRRLELALGIVGDPDLVFLDEPTTGFDPSARRQAWSLVDGLRGLGKTILLTTHYMDEAQHLSDRVIVIAAGEVVADGSADTIGGASSRLPTVSFHIPDGMGVADVPGVAEGQVGDGIVRLTTDDLTGCLYRITGWALEKGLELEGLSVTRPSLEDVYLQLTESHRDE
ncbi:MAG: ABC transporter ATP-binding protein [Acidimicrobiia bacterium]